MKKISIIIPSYNMSKYILNNLEVLCKEKYKNFLDVIIIDDGSTDDTKSKLKDYINKYGFIKYIYQKNSGAPAARNHGIQVATGDYAIFLDADDVLCDDILPKIQNIIKENDYDLILGNFLSINENGILLRENQMYSEKKLIEGEEKYLFACDDPKPGNKIYNLNVIKNNNIFFDDLQIGQDLNFFLKYILVSKKILLLNDYIFKYRIVNGSISRTYSLKILKIKESFDYIKDFYINNDATNFYYKYIEISKMRSYYSQYCKLRFFEKKIDRERIYNFFKKEFKNLEIDKSSLLFKETRKVYYKFKIRIITGKIFISTPYCSLYRLFHGEYHTY